MGLFGGTQGSSNVRTTKRPDLTGIFIDNGDRASKDMLADVKVPSAEVRGSAYRDVFPLPGSYLNDEAVAAMVERAGGDSAMVTARELDAELAKLKPSERGAGNIVRRRIMRLAREAVQQSVPAQAMAHVRARTDVVDRITAARRRTFEAEYNNADNLRRLGADRGGTEPHELSVAVIAEMFPHEAEITGAAAALNDRLSAFTASITGRIAALGMLDRGAPAREAELASLTMEVRAKYEERARKALAAGWQLKAKPFANAADVVPEQLWSHMSRVGELHLFHPEYTPETKRLVGDVLKFLIKVAGE